VRSNPNPPARVSARRGDPIHVSIKGLKMKKELQFLNPRQEISSPKYQGPIRTVLNTLFRLSCWWGAVWVVWNHALSNFFNTGGIGPLLSMVLGSFLYAMATILDD